MDYETARRLAQARNVLSVRNRMTKAGVLADYLNSWMGVASAFDNESLAAALAQDICTYERYVRERYNADEAEKIMKHSDTTRVRELDDVVDEFNAQRKEFEMLYRETGSLDHVTEYIDRVKMLIRKK
jgi:hypothetical protein